MESGYIAIIIVLCAFLCYLTEALPAAVIAVGSVCAMVICKAAPPAEAWSAFGGDSVLLMGGMLAVGASLFSTGAIGRFADAVNRVSKENTDVSIFIMLVTAFFLSAVLNNTTVVVLFLPLILGMIIQADSEKYYEQKYIQALSLMANIGGLLTLVGSGVNVTASGLLEAAGYEGFGFFQFTKIALVLFVISVIYIYTLGNRIAARMKGGRSKLVEEFITEYKNQPHKEKAAFDKRRAVTSLTIMILMTVALLTKDIHRISTGTIGVTAGLLCVITKSISFEELMRKINWSTLLMLGGTIGCATCLSVSGGGEIMARALLGLLGEGFSPRAALAVFCVISAIITQFISNTGTVGILIPVCIPVAASLGISPEPFIMGITLSASCSFLTPMASHVQALIMDWGSYQIVDYIKYSGPVIIMMLAAIIILTPVFYPFI